MQIAIALAWAVLFAHADRAPVTAETLLREMVDADSVARWPSPEYTCRQASSHDRATVAPDRPGWFANHDHTQYLRVEERRGHREHVMMDAEGPGAVVRFFLTTQAGREGVLRFYLDGADVPAFEVPAYDLMSGPWKVAAPLLTPHTSYEPRGGGGSTSYLPIPYAKHCKITWEERRDGKPRYYQIDYRTYAPGTPVRTLDAAGLAAAAPEIERASALLSGERDDVTGEVVGFEARVAPDAERTLTLPAGPAAIRRLELKLRPASPAALRSTVIRARFDGEETVWCPVGDFSGVGVGGGELRGWYRTVTPDGTMTCRWTMPYAKTASLTLQNLGAAPVAASLHATVGPWAWDDRSMHFHASWRQEAGLPTAEPRDVNLLRADGRGVLVGDTLAVFNSLPRWYGEGDEKIYVDGESFPSTIGTGTEDYYNASWAPVVPFQMPFSSAPAAGPSGSLGHNTFTRTRNLDGIPFRKSLRFDMELIHWEKDARVDLAAATYWYAALGGHAADAASPAEATRPVPPQPAPPAKPGATAVAGAIECEGLALRGRTPGRLLFTQDMQPWGREKWSGGEILLFAGEQAGDFVEVVVPAPDDAPRTVAVRASKADDYGLVKFSVNGEPSTATFDGYSERVEPADPVVLGRFRPRDGRFVIRAEVAGVNAKAVGVKALIGMDYVTLSPP